MGDHSQEKMEIRIETIPHTSITWLSERTWAVRRPQVSSYYWIFPPLELAGHEWLVGVRVKYTAGRGLSIKVSVIPSPSGILSFSWSSRAVL